jgi:hypothetical protein
MKRHETTTIPLLSPLATRETRFLLRQGGQSPVGKPLRHGMQTCCSSCTPKTAPARWTGIALLVIGTAGNELWATGEWSETGQGKNGEPLPIKGYGSAIYVREGDDWKVRMAETNTTPDSVILLNKTFAPQPAATPSPTASPSTQ